MIIFEDYSDEESTKITPTNNITTITERESDTENTTIQNITNVPTQAARNATHMAMPISRLRILQRPRISGALCWSVWFIVDEDGLDYWPPVPERPLT